MKKSLFVFVILMLALSISGCSAAENTADIDDIVRDITENVTFQDELTRVDGSISAKLYDMEGVSRSCVMLGSGATSEELAVFEFTDEEGAGAGAAVALARIASQKASFGDYMPGEVRRLDDAVIEQSGRLLIVCVCDDGEASRVIDKYMK